MTDNRKRYYLTTPSSKRPRNHLIRQSIIINYRPIVEANRTVPVHKQFYEIMHAAAEELEYLTRAEIVVLLRPDNLSPKVPNNAEFNAFRRHLAQFRRWIGPLQTIVAYATKENVEGYTPQQIFKPFSKLREYKPISKHIQRVINGLQETDSNNRAVFTLSKKEIQQRREEIHNEILREAQIGRRKKKIIKSEQNEQNGY